MSERQVLRKRELETQFGAYPRDAIRTSTHKIMQRMLEKSGGSFVLYMAHRNYMRPKFWGTHRTDKLSSQRSPAMELKLTDKIESFEEFFEERIPFQKVRLSEDWLDLYHRRDSLSRRPIKEIA